MGKTMGKFGMGWLPDYPDYRDYSSEKKDVHSKLQLLGQTDSVKAMLTKVGVAGPSKRTLPASVDLRKWCSPVEDQGELGSCTAHAGVGLIEYFERRAFGKHIDASRIFLYKVTRNLLHWKGDRGAFIRSTFGAMVLFGLPPEEYWPYDEKQFDEEPPAFCYAFAQNYKAVTYYRLDPDGTSEETILQKIKTNLAAGLASMFGFTVYTSIDQSPETGKIPFPGQDEKILGGHAVAAVGYDDAVRIRNSNPGEAETRGAFLIRNSWGTDWGEQGYGWLPYEYVLKGIAVDWWSLLKNEWVDTNLFGLGQTD